MKPINPEHAELHKAVLSHLKHRLGAYRRGLTAKSVHQIRHGAMNPGGDVTKAGTLAGSHSAPGQKEGRGEEKPGYAEGGEVHEAGNEASEQPKAVEAGMRAQAGLVGTDEKRVNREDAADERDEGPVGDDEAEADRDAEEAQDGEDDEMLPTRLRRRRKLLPTTDSLMDLLVSKKVAR